MITTQETDWLPQVNGVPWMQKARPGLDSAKGRKLPQFVALPLPASCITPDPATSEIAVPGATRKQRLLREAHETEGEVTSVGNDVVMVVVAILVLTIYWGTAAFVAGSSMSQRSDAVQRNVLTLKYEKPMGGSVPVTIPQNRVVNVNDSGAQ